MVCTGEYSRAEAERCEAMIGKEKAMMRLAEAEEKRGVERARNSAEWKWRGTDAGCAGLLWPRIEWSCGGVALY